MRRRHERGASAVEAALVTPVFLLMVVAILEFGMYFKDSLTVSNAASAAVRVASSQPRMSTFATDAAVKATAESGALARTGTTQLWVYEANDGNNFPKGYSSFANCTTCVKFTWNGTAFAQTSSAWPSTTHDACSASPPDRIGVHLTAVHPGVTRMIFSSITIQRASVLRFEPVPSRLGCK